MLFASDRFQPEVGGIRRNANPPASRSSGRSASPAAPALAPPRGPRPAGTRSPRPAPMDRADLPRTASRSESSRPTAPAARSEERRVGKSVDLGGRQITKKKSQ